MADEAPRGREERFGWRTLRLPPPMSLVVGAIYGAIAGAIIVWDAVVLLRVGKILKRRISDEVDARRNGSD